MYCLNHTCKEQGCFNRVAQANSVCDKCQNKSNRKRNAEITRQNERTGEKSTKKYSMPDCDDYDSYEDFMDDWDGFMPDGSDAEDYWENW